MADAEMIAVLTPHLPVLWQQRNKKQNNVRDELLGAGPDTLSK